MLLSAPCRRALGVLAGLQDELGTFLDDVFSGLGFSLPVPAPASTGHAPFAYLSGGRVASSTPSQQQGQSLTLMQAVQARTQLVSRTFDNFEKVIAPSLFCIPCTRKFSIIYPPCLCQLELRFWQFSFSYLYERRQAHLKPTLIFSGASSQHRTSSSLCLHFTFSHA